MKISRYQRIMKPLVVLLLNLLLSFSMIIGFGSSIGYIPAFALAVLVPVIYSAVVSYDLKKGGWSIKRYIVAFSVCEVVLLVLMMNHSFAAKVFCLFTGNYNLEATGFYLLYALLPCTGGLIGLGFGYGIWRLIKMF